MQHGQVVYNAANLGENLSLTLGCNNIKFERRESDASSDCSYGEEDDNTISELSSHYNKLRLTVNHRHRSKFEFYDKRCDRVAVEVSARGINMEGNKIEYLGCPVCPGDATTKYYVDQQVNNQISKVRSGLIYLSDISNRNANLSATGCITNATVSSSFGSNDCFVNFTFNDNGYVPVVMITVQNNMGNADNGNITPPVLTTVTSYNAQIYLREIVSSVQAIILHIMVLDPGMNYSPY